MAISLTYKKTVHGRELTFTEAYIKVVSVVTSAEVAYARTTVYLDAQKNDVLEERDYSFVPDMSDDSTNCIKQAYLHIKSLPEYSEGLDC